VKLPKKIKETYNEKIIDSTLLPRLIQVLGNSQKTIKIDGIKTSFEGVKECDVEFVGVALQSHAVLVTGDEKLKDAISADKTIASNCNCSTVEDCIP